MARELRVGVGRPAARRPRLGPLGWSASRLAPDNVAFPLAQHGAGLRARAPLRRRGATANVALLWVNDRDRTDDHARPGAHRRLRARRPALHHARGRAACIARPGGGDRDRAAHRLRARRARRGGDDARGRRARRGPAAAAGASACGARSASRRGARRRRSTRARRCGSRAPAAAVGLRASGALVVVGPGAGGCSRRSTSGRPGGALAGRSRSPGSRSALVVVAAATVPGLARRAAPASRRCCAAATLDAARRRGHGRRRARRDWARASRSPPAARWAGVGADDRRLRGDRAADARRSPRCSCACATTRPCWASATSSPSTRGPVAAADASGGPGRRGGHAALRGRRRGRVPARRAAAADRLPRRPHALRGAAAGRRAGGCARDGRGGGRARASPTRSGCGPGSTLATLDPTGRELRLQVVGIVRALDNSGRVAWVTERDARRRRAGRRRPERPAARAGRRPGRGGRAAARARLRARSRVGGATTRDTAPSWASLAAVLRAVALAVGLVCLYALVQGLAMTARERRGALAVLRACGGGAARRRRACSPGAAAAVAVPAGVAGDRCSRRSCFGPLVTAPRRGLRRPPAAPRRSSRSSRIVARARPAGRARRRARRAPPASASRRRGPAGGRVSRALRTRRASRWPRRGLRRRRGARGPVAPGGVDARAHARRPRRRRRPASARPASRCATAPTSRPARDPGAVLATLAPDHRPARARRGVARARAVPRPLRGAVRADLPARRRRCQRAGARRRGPRVNRQRAGRRARDRRPDRQRPAQRARPRARACSTAAGSIPTRGAPGYRGVQDADDPDPFYYRPDVDPPRHPGLLDAAQRPFASPGLNAPWYAAPGQPRRAAARASSPPDARTDAIADRRRSSSRRSTRARELPESATTAEAVDALLGAAEGGRTITVPADPDRGAVPPAGVRRTRSPSGRATRAPDRLDYAVDVGARPRVVVLDLVNRDGRRGARRRRGAARVAARAARAAAGTAVIVVDPPAAAGGGARRRSTRAPASSPSVHGDTHRNRIDAARRLLGDRHVVARRPPACRRGCCACGAATARARDLDGRPGRPRSRRHRPRARVPRRPGRAARRLGGRARRTATPACILP